VAAAIAQAFDRAATVAKQNERATQHPHALRLIAQSLSDTGRVPVIDKHKKFLIGARNQFSFFRTAPKLNGLNGDIPHCFCKW
jgi:hypothetical protein